MSEKPKSTAEKLASSYQFYLFLFSMFAIAMGLARYFGKAHWEEIERALRQDRDLPVATLSSSGDSAFTYSSLLQGGLLSIAVVFWLSLYIVFMLAFFYRRNLHLQIQAEPAAVLRSVSILALYPVLMMPVFIYQSFQPHLGKFSFPYLVGFGLVVVAAAAVGLVPMGVAKSVRTRIVMVGASLTAMAVLASYATGQREGIEAADPTTNSYVAVRTIAGGEVQGWLYETTGSDYRLVMKDGLNMIVPAASVRDIREITTPEGEVPAEPTPPGAASPSG